MIYARYNNNESSIQIKTLNKKMEHFMNRFRFFIVALATSILSANFENNPLLNKDGLTTSSQIQEILLQRGFKKIFFTTEDNIKLCGLFLDQSTTKKVKGTILYCAGFYPGVKEGMSSFYTLVEDLPYNFLLFDARGHHESEGSLFSYNNLKQYGSCEYQDIVTAIKFITTYNKQHNISENIVIHGICCGAFHSIKACNYLQSENCAECKNIKGIIFDSGWFKLCDIAELTIKADIEKRLKNSWFSWLIKPFTFVTLQWYRLTLKHYHCKVEGISESIQNIPCPIWFVHCMNDPYVPFDPIQKLVSEKKYPHSWWIEHNIHANYHAVKPDEYRTRLIDFLNSL